MSGLRINYDKSTMIPINYEADWMKSMKYRLKCMVVNLHVKYLGIPLCANPKKVSTWRLIIEKIEKKLNRWKASLSSKAGKLVMIKAILNRLPLYFLGLFKMLN